MPGWGNYAECIRIAQERRRRIAPARKIFPQCDDHGTSALQGRNALGEDSRASERTKAKERNLMIPWPMLSLGLLVVTASSLGSLVVVATVKDADVLSTVALALAVLAFAAQLVISIAQSQTANQQLVQSERINTETRALLTDVRATSQSLLTTARDQFNTVLQHALRQIPDAIEEASQEEGVSPADLEERLTQSFQRTLQEYLPRAPILPSPDRPTPRTRRTASKEDLELIDRMRTYPDEKEGEPLLGILNQLSPIAASALQSKAEREISMLRVGRSPGAFLSPDGAPITEELVQKGLAEEVEAPPDRKPPGDTDTRRFARLTPMGRDVARLLIGHGPLPAWLKHRFYTPKS